MSGYLTATHNPAVSFDLGAQLWAIGEPRTAEAMSAYAHIGLPHVDVDTALFGWSHINASFEADCLLNPPPKEIEQCPFSPLRSSHS